MDNESNIRENISIDYEITQKTACCTEEPSKVIGFLENDYEPIANLVESNKLLTRYIRNTNATGVYEQRGGTCYAYAACSAYINSIMRIYGSRPPPSFSECYEIACYNGPNGGLCEKSLQLLENHFQYGIVFDSTDAVSIADSITLSVIVSFKTSEEGWINVANGKFLEFPGGEANGWHDALVEGYDLEKDCMICKNSWGGETAEPRFDFTASAAHDFRFTRVYFTLKSIQGKTNKEFKSNLIKCNEIIKGKTVDCTWLEPITAKYCSNYVCEYHPENQGIYKYYGYNIFQWIDANHKRHKKLKHSKYYYINKELKKQYEIEQENKTCLSECMIS